MKRSVIDTFFTFGRPIGPCYGLAMRIRALLYRQNILASRSVGVPVISVGNITMGGSGKTPLVMFLAAYLQRNGFKPGVISRGYRGTARESINVVSDGHSLLLSPAAAGDEPYLIAATLPGVVVATGAKRVHPCRYAVSSLGCDIIILDDGFQHLSVRRSLDLVLFDADFFLGNGRIFPGGDLREPLSALGRCDGFIVTNATVLGRQRVLEIEATLQRRFPEIPIITVSGGYRYMQVISHTPGGPVENRVAVPDMDRPLYGFCGIARPERFERMLVESNIKAVGFQFFPDHHRYSDSDMAALCSAAERAGASGLVTTEKDMVKIATLHPCRLPLYVPHLEITATDPLERYIYHHVIKKGHEKPAFS